MIPVAEPGPIVGSKEYEGVVLDTVCLESPQNLSRDPIHFLDSIGKTGVPGLVVATKVGRGPLALVDPWRTQLVTWEKGR